VGPGRKNRPKFTSVRECESARVRWIRRAHRCRRAPAAPAQHAPAAASRASAGEQSARADFVSFQPPAPTGSASADGRRRSADPDDPLPFSCHSEGRPRRSHRRATARRPVESSLPARGPGAAATRKPALGTADAAKGLGQSASPPISPEPKPLRPRRCRRCRAQASLLRRLDPTALPSFARRQAPRGRASG